MNKDFEIYQADDESIPTEDKARLEGYLHGRAEAVDLSKVNETKKSFADEMEKLKNFYR